MTGSSGIAHPALRSGEERERAFIAHPFLTDKARFPTPSIKALFPVIKNAVIQRDSGVSFTADPRFGKTSAIEVLQHALPQSFPEIPIFRTNAKHHQKPSERALLCDMLHDFGIRVGERSIAHQVRRRLLNLMITASQQHESDRIMLFVDEAQNWHEDELTWIRDISNDLELIHIRVIVIMFAHPDLHELRSSLIGRRTDLIGRFLTKLRTFNGISSTKDVEAVFALLDDAGYSDFPAGSGVSYSQFFRPVEFDQGWRLSSEAASCWSAFQREIQKFKGHREIGMRWLIVALRTWLCAHWASEHGSLPDNENLWEVAVEESDFAASLNALSMKRQREMVL